MILIEEIRENLIRHYSDEGKPLRHKKYGLVCAEAFEDKDNRDDYVEIEEEATAADYKEALESLGVNFDV